MAFTWTGQLGPGSELSAEELETLGLGRDFSDRAAAEAWLAGAYLDLSDAGVISVSLFEDGTLVYGPMSLDE